MSDKLPACRCLRDAPLIRINDKPAACRTSHPRFSSFQGVASGMNDFSGNQFSVFSFQILAKSDLKTEN